jgi:hypothetical protein
MSLKDKGIVFFLKLRARTERNGSGDVCGAEKILAARVTQVKAVAEQLK